MLQGIVLRGLTYIWLRYLNTNTSQRANPIYQLFTFMWTTCLRHSSRRWNGCFSSFTPPTLIVAGAANEHETIGSINEPLVHHDRRSGTGEE